jgi:hypothetical protein
VSFTDARSERIELRGYPLDLLPLHDMTAGVYRAVRLDTVDNVVAEMDRVTVAGRTPGPMRVFRARRPVRGWHALVGSARPARSRLLRRPHEASEIRRRCNRRTDPQREIAGSVLPVLCAALAQRCVLPLPGVAVPLPRALESTLRARRVRRSPVKRQRSGRRRPDNLRSCSRSASASRSSQSRLTRARFALPSNSEIRRT